MFNYDINPHEADIDAAYDALSGATLNDLNRLIPRWGLGMCTEPCHCEYLVLRSVSHPNAIMLAAGRRLGERLGIPEGMVSWQPLDLHS